MPHYQAKEAEEREKEVVIIDNWAAFLQIQNVSDPDCHQPPPEFDPFQTIGSTYAIWQPEWKFTELSES